MTKGAAELGVVLCDPGRERGAVLAPVLLPLECCGCGAALDALLFPWVLECIIHDAFMMPSEHLFTDFFVPVQI